MASTPCKHVASQPHPMFLLQHHCAPCTDEEKRVWVIPEAMAVCAAKQSEADTESPASRARNHSVAFQLTLGSPLPAFGHHRTHTNSASSQSVRAGSKHRQRGLRHGPCSCMDRGAAFAPGTPPCLYLGPLSLRAGCQLLQEAHETPTGSQWPAALSSRATSWCPGKEHSNTASCRTRNPALNACL